MPDCVFCKIIRGDAEASVVHEDEISVAFMDLFPVNPGHVLVVPREHHRDPASCPGATASHLFSVACRLAPVVTEAVGADGFNIWTANGSAAGQEVFHLHLHLLPRFSGDSFGLRFPKGYPTAVARPELDRMAAAIRELL